VSVLLGNGDGSFQAAQSFPAGRYTIAVAVGDFDLDGKLDVAVANNDLAGKASVLRGNGDGTFQTALSYTAGAYAVSLVVADLNGDGPADLAVAHENGVAVLVGNGDGTFKTAQNFAAGTSPIAVAAGDLQGDGAIDLAVANYNLVGGGVVSLLNTCVPAIVSLAIVRSNASVTISWAAPSSGFMLESTPGLSLPDWQPVVEAAINNNDRWEVTLPIGPGARYFRLHKN